MARAIPRRRRMMAMTIAARATPSWHPNDVRPLVCKAFRQFLVEWVPKRRRQL
jgi:hypothetical protein